MTRRTSNNILQIFAPDVRKWIEDQARAEQVKPETIIKERIRELAEHEKAARACG